MAAEVARPVRRGAVEKGTPAAPCHSSGRATAAKRKHDVLREVEALLPSDSDSDSPPRHPAERRGLLCGVKAAAKPPASASTTPPRKRVRPPDAAAPHPAPPAAPEAFAFTRVDYTPAPPPQAQHPGQTPDALQGCVLPPPQDSRAAEPPPGAVFRGKTFAVVIGGRSLGGVRAKALGAVIQKNGGSLLPGSALGAADYVIIGFDSTDQLSRFLRDKLAEGSRADPNSTLLRRAFGPTQKLCPPSWVSQCVTRRSIVPPPAALQPHGGFAPDGCLYTSALRAAPRSGGGGGGGSAGPGPPPSRTTPVGSPAAAPTGGGSGGAGGVVVAPLFGADPLQVGSIRDRTGMPKGKDDAGFIPVFFSGEGGGVAGGPPCLPEGGGDGGAPPPQHTGSVSFAARGNRLPPKGIFACEKPHVEGGGEEAGKPGSGAALNENLISELSRLQEVYAKLGDHWRKYAYSKAIAVIRKWKSEIRAKADIEHVRGIGSKIADKIDEILKKGTTGKMQYFNGCEEVTVVTMFAKIWGVGPVTAQRLYKTHHITSIEELRLQQHQVLNQQQQVGLRYIEELQHRIPRSEVDCMKRIISKAVKAVNPDLAMEICGSYRRGKDTCGDADVILCDPSGRPSTGMLKKAVMKLSQLGFITDELTSAYMNDVNAKEDHDSFMGVCQMPPCRDAATCPHAHLCEVAPQLSPTTHLHRRIDIKLYTPEQYPFALLYFTGSDYFNRSMRLYCHKRGYSLSDKGIQPVVRVAKEVVHEGAYLQGCRMEKDIFDLLGLQYKTPEERNV